MNRNWNHIIALVAFMGWALPSAFSQELGVSGGVNLENGRSRELEEEEIKIGNYKLHSATKFDTAANNKAFEGNNIKGLFTPKIIERHTKKSPSEPLLDPIVIQSWTNNQRKLLLEKKTSDISALAPKDQAGRDAIKKQYAKDVNKLLAGRDYANELWLMDRKERHNGIFLPARNAYTSMLVHGENNAASGRRLSFLNSGGIQINGTDSKSSLSFNSELAAGYLGPLRVSLSTSLSDVSGLELDSAALSGLSSAGVDSLVDRVDSLARTRGSLQNLLASGGTGSLKVSLPLWWVGLGRMRPAENGDEERQLLFAGNAFYRVNTLIPRLGEQVKDPKFAQELGVEAVAALNFEATGDDRISTFRLLAKGKFAMVGGKEFINSIGLPDMSTAGVVRYELGIVLSDAFYISYTGLNAWGKTSTDVNRSTNVRTLGISFLNF